MSIDNYVYKESDVKEDMINIEVNVGEQKIKLTIDECKELYNKLDLLFGDKNDLPYYQPYYQNDVYGDYLNY